MTAVTAMKMPPTRAALVEVMSGVPRHGETTLNPRPAPRASSSRVKAAATKPPAMMAGHETAEAGCASFSTMTVSTMAFPHISPAATRGSRRGCNRGSPSELGRAAARLVDNRRKTYDPAMAASRTVTIAIDGATTVSGLWLRPAKARACLVLAHGAGAGMAHRSMAALADGLAARGIATLRYQFTYMERGSRRPDPPAAAHAAVRAACAKAARLAGPLPLFAGGKSYGGRMTSQAQALTPLGNVRGLVFFAFPLHPAGKPSTARAGHLGAVAIPMLFLQGTRDALAELELLRPVVRALGRRAKLVLAPDADHAFHVPARTGRHDADVLAALLDAAASWMTPRAARARPTRKWV